MCQVPPVHGEVIKKNFHFVLKQYIHFLNGDIEIINFLYYDLKWGWLYNF